MQDVQPLKSTAYTLGGMLILGAADNSIPNLSSETGLWLFQALRTAMIVPILALFAVFGLGVLRARRPARVLARNFFTGTALLIYFGCLAFLPIGVVVAGLFTAPIFVLLISVGFRGILYGRLFHNFLEPLVEIRDKLTRRLFRQSAGQPCV